FSIFFRFIRWWFLRLLFCRRLCCLILSLICWWFRLRWRGWRFSASRALLRPVHFPQQCSQIVCSNTHAVYTELILNIYILCSQSCNRQDAIYKSLGERFNAIPERLFPVAV